MAKKEFTPISISDDTKKKLLLLKKHNSYESLISSMVTYFITTGYDPFLTKNNPVLEVQNDIERIIKIIKAQEKTYLKPILEGYQYSKKDTPTTVAKQVSELDGLTANELKVILEKNTNLTEEVQNLTEEIEVLRTFKQRTILDQSSKPDSRINVISINQSLDAILEECGTNKFKEGEVTILRSSLNSYIDRIRKELI